MTEEKEKILIQHMESYKNTILEIINNNTNSLIEDDLKSLMKKPPLDSMDQIKTKFLALAKKNKVVLKDEELNKIINNYRKEILKCCDEIKSIRINKLKSVVENTKLVKMKDTIKLGKKDFSSIDKDIRKLLKENIEEQIDSKILKNIDKVFDKSIDENISKKIVTDITKYLKSSYIKQLLENVDIKILVKDTTLINSTKEQAERYLFTINNSRLLND